MSAVINKAPGASFNREYVPEKAASVLVLKDSTNTYTLRQYVNPLNEYYRPVHFDTDQAIKEKLSSSSSLDHENQNKNKIPHTPERGKLDKTEPQRTEAQRTEAQKTEVQKTEVQKALTPNSNQKKHAFISPKTGTPRFPFATRTPNGTCMTSKRAFKIDLKKTIHPKTEIASSDIVSSDGSSPKIVSPDIVSPVITALGDNLEKSTFIGEALLFHFSPERDPSRIKESQTQHTGGHKKRNKPKTRKLEFIDTDEDEGTEKANTLEVKDAKKGAKTDVRTDAKTDASNPITTRKKPESNSNEFDAEGASDTKKLPDPSVRGGEWVTLPLRKKNKISQKPKRSEDIDQHAVMKKSAKEALLEVAKDENRDPELKAKLTLLAEYAFDWSHAIAYSLAPSNFKPQAENNMASTPKWINTYMMGFEKIARYFAKKYPKAVSIKPTFTLLDKTHLAKTLDYEVQIKEGLQEVTVKGTLNVLELPDRSNVPSSSDAVQTIYTLNQIFDRKEPSLSTTIAFALPTAIELPIAKADTIKP